MPIGVPEAITAEFLDFALTGGVSRDWLGSYGRLFDGFYDQHGTLGAKPPETPAPARPLADYVGAYVSPYYGPGEITARDGMLLMRLGPERTEFALRHWDGDTFAYETTGENASGLQGVSFATGTAGPVVSFTVEDLNREADGRGDLGVFSRH